MYPVSAEYLAKVRERWQEQQSIDEPMLPDTSTVYSRDSDKADAYQNARLQLIRAIAKKRMKPKEIANHLFELADAFPEKSATLVAEAAWWGDRAVAQDAALEATAVAGFTPAGSIPLDIRPEVPTPEETPPSAPHGP
jgi:hypothetical protein